jgi:ribosomal protein S6--L-glutamate ligase
MPQLNLLVIATGYPGKLLKTIESRGHKYTLAKPEDFDLYISDNPKGFDELFLFGSRFVASKYDAVLSRVGERREFASKILRHLQHNLNVFCVQSGSSLEVCADKFKAAQIMSENKIKVPRQFYSLRGKYPALMIEKMGGLPIILKELSGSKGKGLILLESPLQTNMTLESYFGSERRFILQEYLNNGGSDERHIVCGGKVVNSMRRFAPADDIRANLSLAGKGEPIQADQETAEMCIKAVKAISGLNFAGVDIMKVPNQDNPSEDIRYFIEINSNPGEKIIDITGHNHYEDLLDFVEGNCRKKAEGKRTEEQDTREPAPAPGPGTAPAPEPGKKDTKKPGAPGTPGAIPEPEEPEEEPEETTTFEKALQNCLNWLKK